MKDDIPQLVKQVREWLENPLESGIDDALLRSKALLAELQGMLQSNPDSGKILGPLLGKVRGWQNRLQDIEPIDWVKVGNGSMAIGHRPSKKLITDIRLQGGTHIFTLLSESEGAKSIQKETLKEDMQWLWFGMSSAAPPREERMPELLSVFSAMEEALNNEARIYIHCSAGIHRTGMISYGFLRYLGLPAAEAINKLNELRPTTREGVGDDRLEWGERFGSD
ncbi:MAG: dual specificity protein phosphatase family protein [Gracilimonas sp.]|uniref:protein-tyrosine phosphatase family protein n=1 Tax=Gracilimonas sp. TaxID=1974203 RepID=UPI00198D5179|nr:tyrosine-protein phosphatase [Gracilimonas sp.]MBD3616910.1 dual specificity protein phosphatase family protein [Gracilimonas sp.]